MRTTSHVVCQIALLLLLALVAGAGTAGAQTIGFQAGGSVDPEQFYVGTHFESPELASNFAVKVGIDGGFGSDLTSASINLDFLYKISVGTSWKIYQGGGPVVYIVKATDLDVTETTGGLGIVFGFAHEKGFFTEFRVAGGDGPAVKFGAGWAIRL